jgi:hypothetical protein
MSWLARVTLSLLHLLYACIIRILYWRGTSSKHTRTRIPSHLALLLIAEDFDDSAAESVQECLLQSLQCTAGWCRLAGIQKLTVYDRQGTIYIRILYKTAQRLQTPQEYFPGTMNGYLKRFLLLKLVAIPQNLRSNIRSPLLYRKPLFREVSLQQNFLLWILMFRL